MRILIAFILFITNLHSQESPIILIKETGYTIHNLDTLISYEVEYDSLSRKLRITNYPLFDDSGIVRINEFNYTGDTTIELHRTISFDTLKKTTTINRDNLELKLEDRTYGFWTSGKYSKAISNVVYRYDYNESNKLIESIFYSENRDTFYHNFYNYQTDTLCSGNISIHYVYDRNGNQLGKRITQKGINCPESINCDSNCTKIIIIESDLSAHSTVNIFIVNGDTTTISKVRESKLPNGYKTISWETINYDGSSSTYEKKYYKENFLYLKESFSWINEKWSKNTEEKYQLDAVNNIRTTKRITYRNGEKNHEYNSYVEYKYKKPMHNKP